jgi:hypothetical protein
VPHNPRRSREPEPASILTQGQIADALDRAVALRRRCARDPEEVQPQPHHPGDAVGDTEGWRLNTRWCRTKRCGATEPDPWWWVGWVNEASPANCLELGELPCWPSTWAVWLNVGDGRVWLKLERYRRWADPGDPYP